MADEKDESKLELPSFGIFGSKGKRKAGQDEDESSGSTSDSGSASASSSSAPEDTPRPSAETSAETSAEKTSAPSASSTASASSSPSSSSESSGSSSTSGSTTTSDSTTTATAASGSSSSAGSRADRSSSDSGGGLLSKVANTFTSSSSGSSGSGSDSPGDSGSRKRPGVGEAKPEKPAEESSGPSWSLTPDEPGASLSDRLPSLSGQVAAGVVGAIVGLVGVVLTFGVLSACDAVRGTSTCGAAGVPLLIAVLLVMVVVGRLLLGAWNIMDPSGTAFLAVGLVAVISLVVFSGILLQWYMIIVLPIVSVIAHLISHFVTTAFVEMPDEDYEKVSTT